MTVLVGNELDASYGLRTLSVSGDCPVFVGALDAGGNPLQPENDLQLSPGAAPIAEYYPPQGAAQIVAVCSNECSGTSVLTYDTPMVA